MSAVSPLTAKLKAKIEADGPLTVETFMDICLNDPEHGYYRVATPIGRGGDFITAPEISQTFGEMIGLWAADMWRSMGQPKPFNLIEFGPGRGTLMADALRAGRIVPGFLEAVELHLIETSKTLRAEQERQLCVYHPHWHEGLATVPPRPSIAIANEFFDALPIRQIVYQDGAWRERRVGLANTGFHFLAAEETMMAGLPHGEEGEVKEICPSALRLIEDMALIAELHPLVMLIIDYGHREAGSGDTLQAVARHRFADPLNMPGRLDLSAHVDFAGLAEHGRGLGLRVSGPLELGLFLTRLGIGERLQRLCHAAPEQAEGLRAGVRRLISPAHMGALFQVMALSAHAPAPIPF